MKKEIVEFFQKLSYGHEHLKHLNELSVVILDWKDLRSRLEKNPHLMFRWFPFTRPKGLILLDDYSNQGTFRSFLDSNKLPYYSLSQHLKHNPTPPEIEIPNEENLLALLEGNDTTGLILTGSGGIGKSRLTLEFGRLALSRGWLVLRAQSRLREDALELLAKSISTNTPVLLLIDYIETQKNFSKLVEI